MFQPKDNITFHRIFNLFNALIFIKNNVTINTGNKRRYKMMMLLCYYSVVF